MPTSRLTVSGEERTRLAKARLGQRVMGKWRLDRLIGIGGMAAVFEATHQNGNRVAIKILHPDLAGFDEIRERFLAEGYAANRVAHAGAVTVRDEGTTDDGAVFLVMDLLRGQTLAERLEPGGAPLSVGEALEICAQLLDVLVHAHDRGIVHRDIKPENIFLTREGRVRLLDFGIARIQASKRRHETEAGTALGTPAFMSPEQALGRWDALDGRSDLWSLGATMYLVLSGLPVREPGSVSEQLLAAMTRPVPSLGDVTSLPRSVVAAVDRALAFDRDDRFPDARSMQLAVRAVLGKLSTPDARATLPTPPVEPTPPYLRIPRRDGRKKRLSTSTIRPVSASTTPMSAAAQQHGKSALPIYVTLGFALGIGIVVAARLPVRSEQPAAAAELQPVASVPRFGRPPEQVSVTAPGREAAPPASASSSGQTWPRHPRPKKRSVEPP